MDPSTRSLIADLTERLENLVNAALIRPKPKENVTPAETEAFIREVHTDLKIANPILTKLIELGGNWLDLIDRIDNAAEKQHEKVSHEKWFSQLCDIAYDDVEYDFEYYCAEYLDMTGKPAPIPIETTTKVSPGATNNAQIHQPAIQIAPLDEVKAEESPCYHDNDTSRIHLENHQQSVQIAPPDEVKVDEPPCHHDTSSIYLETHQPAIQIAPLDEVKVEELLCHHDYHTVISVPPGVQYSLSPPPGFDKPPKTSRNIWNAPLTRAAPPPATRTRTRQPTTTTKRLRAKKTHRKAKHTIQLLVDEANRPMPWKSIFRRHFKFRRPEDRSRVNNVCEILPASRARPDWITTMPMAILTTNPRNHGRRRDKPRMM